MKKHFYKNMNGFIGFFLLILLYCPMPLTAVSQLKQFGQAPSFDLLALNKEPKRITLESLQGKPTILIFGELYNKNTLDALKELGKTLPQTGMSRNDLEVCLIITKNPGGDFSPINQSDPSLNLLVLHDPSRLAFGAYGVVVLPSVVVLDKQSNISLAMSGYPLTFTDMITDAILFATGKLTQKQFLASSGSNYQAAPVEENRIRAARLTGLARQLFRRGYADLALENFEKALNLDPQYLAGRIGLARCLIKLNRLDQAEKQLDQILQSHQDNPQANLAIAYIEITRGGEEMILARHRLDRILAHNPHDPEAHYLMGLVYEFQNDKNKAIENFKKAAELLLEIKSRQ